jgi:hypothetical protein
MKRVEGHFNSAEGATMKMEISVGTLSALSIAAFMFLQLAYTQSTPQGS